MNTRISLKDSGVAVVVGASGGIGRALVSKILEDGSMKVVASVRSETQGKALSELNTSYSSRLVVVVFDPTDEGAYPSFVDKVREVGASEPLRLLINCVGVLEDDKFGLFAEKNLAQVNMASLSHAFQVNAFVTPMLAKYFFEMFRQKSASALISLSAKVGSIADNELGGWYSYRASKAALNMFVKTIALEYSRRGCNCLVLAIHPGTTRTQLTEKHLSGYRGEVVSPDITAARILDVISRIGIEKSGSFIHANGDTLPW
jgi:NAD(P)-dependent dehydrogenase (short-subunit alcohol dehydrogenase family)